MRITDVEKFTVSRSESNFDRACESAYGIAIATFEINEAGYSDRADLDFQRTTDELVVRFTGYTYTGSMAGKHHKYEFFTWIERHDDAQ